MAARTRLRCWSLIEEVVAVLGAGLVAALAIFPCAPVPNAIMEAAATTNAAAMQPALFNKAGVDGLDTTILL
jgi:hypothetical protein